MAVSQRRRQLASLRALGWSSLQLATLVELETAVIGLAAGLVAMVSSIPILLRVHQPLAVAAAAPPLGLLIAGLAALPAAWTASRGSVVSALQRPQPVRPARPPASTAAVAARELRRSWPIETALAASAVALGAILVGLVVLVAAGFRTQLDTTVLGTALDTKVRPFDVALAGLSLVLGAGAAAQVMVLAWLSRRRELGVLKALGWSGPRLAWLVCWQACLVGLLGAAGATPFVLVCAKLLDAPHRSIALGLSATVGGCLAATLVAAVVPCLLALREPARRLLQT
jgi:putative ABC transport system permease protein